MTIDTPTPTNTDDQPIDSERLMQMALTGDDGHKDVQLAGLSAVADDLEGLYELLAAHGQTTMANLAHGIIGRTRVLVELRRREMRATNGRAE